MKTFTSPGDVEAVKKLMKEKPIIIFFFMEGCPHCDATRPAWSNLKTAGLPYEFAEVESAAVPPESGITGFPHFQVVRKNGDVKTSDGRKETAKELADSLGLNINGNKRAGLRRLRRTRRRNTRRLTRRVRK